MVAGLYGQSLGFGYVWDDGPLFVENTLLREGVWSWATVARPILPDAPYFRPLVLATWMAEMQLFKLSPLYSHAINTLLHAINACLVYLMACRLFEQRREAKNAALFAALVFVVHPCLIEGVAWISGRFDLLATTLLLAGWVIAMSPVTATRCVLVGVLALGAMLSKEIGVLFAPLLVLIAIARNPEQPLRATLRVIWPYIFAYAIAAICYFILRSQGLGFASYSNFGKSQILDAILHYEVWLGRLSFYTFMAFMPFNSVGPLHDVQMEALTYRQHFGAMSFALLLFGVVVWFSFRRRAWALLWLGFYAGIFPVLGFFSININGVIGADRFLYLPIIMLALGLAGFALAVREKSQQRVVAITGLASAAGWLILATFVTFTVTPMWASGIQLWGWQYHLNPDNRLVRLYYFNDLSNSGSPEMQNLFKNEIAKIQQNNKGRLPMEAQIAYSNFLLRNNDPESLPYLEGLVLNMGIRGAEGVRLHETIYAGILVNYAQAVMVFQGDLETAREAMEEAKTATPRGTEFQLVHQMIVLEYLDGKKQNALDIYRNNFIMLKAYGIDKMNSSMKLIAEETCKKKNWPDCASYALDFIGYINAGAVGKTGP